MKKSMLEKYTSRYDKVPSWLMIMLPVFCLWICPYGRWISSRIVLGVPMTVIPHS